MPRNALHDETKSGQVTVVSPAWRGNVRIQPTIEVLLDEARPSTEGKGDQLLHGALKSVLIAGIVTGDWHWVYSALGRVLGLTTTSGGVSPNGGTS